MQHSRIVAFAVFLLAPLPSRAADEAPQPASTAPGVKEMRAAVERGLAFVEKDALAWWQVRKCNSCHHGPFLLWSHAEARRAGFPVDADKFSDWTRQALDFYLGNLKDYQTKKNGNVEGSHLLLGMTQHTGPKAVEPIQEIAKIVVAGQKDEGYWKYEGQGLKRADQENNEAATLWALLALAPLEKVSPALVKARERSLAWLRTAPPSLSNELVAARIVAETRFGDRSHAKALAQDLAGKQNADGGWSWTKERPSDAFGTGQVLYALGTSGYGPDDPAVNRGWSYLVKTQKPDGAWESPTRKPNASDNPIAHYWGTVWAVMGLARTAGPTK